MRSSKDANHLIVPRNKPANKKTATQLSSISKWLMIMMYFTQSLASEALANYPIRPNRYNSLGWNRNYQYCYTEEEVSLLKKIQHEYHAILANSNADNYFELSEYKKVYDFWTCVIPTYTQRWQQYGTESYTLPTRASKDLKISPLWDYADHVSKQIANWQSERAKHQHLDLVNDPVMIVFEELKDWYFNSLANTECHSDVGELIAKRQSYIKNIVHFIPNFGPDRLHLHEIQQSLGEASKLILYCIAKKELPEYLSEAIIGGKSLETTIGTYLHFLLVNEEVSDNFSHNYLINPNKNCESSPICKVYRNALGLTTALTDLQIRQSLPATNPFYEFTQISEENNFLEIEVNLKKNLYDKIQFAKFVTMQDKQNYVESIAILESLINVRKILENFQNLLPQIGTYAFALNYLEQVDKLSINYLKLINKLKELVMKLLHSADKGLNDLLSDSIHTSKNHFFESNLRSLETRVAKGTTVIAQLEKYCINAADSMHKYQNSMRKLVRSLNSGEELAECEQTMLELFSQMNTLNVFLPAIIEPSLLKIENSEIERPRLKMASSSLTTTSGSQLTRNSFFSRAGNAIKNLTHIIADKAKQLSSNNPMLNHGIESPLLENLTPAFSTTAMISEFQKTLPYQHSDYIMPPDPISNSVTATQSQDPLLTPSSILLFGTAIGALFLCYKYRFSLFGKKDLNTHEHKHDPFDQQSIPKKPISKRKVTVHDF